MKARCMICGSDKGVVKHEVIPKECLSSAEKAEWVVYVCTFCHQEVHEYYRCAEKERYIRYFLEFMNDKRLEKDNRILKLDAKEITDNRKRVEAEKELAYLETQKVLGQKLHGEIEKSLKKLEELGYPVEKVNEVKSLFE